MTRAQLNRFKKTLEARRDELAREITEKRERLAIALEGDSMDQVRSIAERDFAVRSIARMYEMLCLVEGALQEIREGTFGFCARCGDEIPAKRLRAVPWSPYCVSCQEMAEQSGFAGEFSVEARYALAS